MSEKILVINGVQILHDIWEGSEWFDSYGYQAMLIQDEICRMLESDSPSPAAWRFMKFRAVYLAWELCFFVPREKCDEYLSSKLDWYNAAEHSDSSATGMLLWVVANQQIRGLEIGPL